MTEHDDQTGAAVPVAEREFSIWVDPDSLPGEGRHVRLAPTEDERGAIAGMNRMLGIFVGLAVIASAIAAWLVVAG